MFNLCTVLLSVFICFVAVFVFVLFIQFYYWWVESLDTKPCRYGGLTVLSTLDFKVQVRI